MELNKKAAYLPVSYTHLDVYKRQVVYGVSLVNKVEDSIRPAESADRKSVV